MSQQGAASHDTSITAVQSLTGNSGLPVGPDVAGNIDLMGDNPTGIDIVGTPASNLLTVLGIQATTTQIGVTEFSTSVETGTLTDTSRAITPDALEPILATGFVVAPNGTYTTIQSACDAANTAGGGIVVVRPGAYTEDLTLYDDVHILGLTVADAGGGVEITGIHLPPTTGGFVFRNVRLISATHIFNSAAPGSSHLIIIDSDILVTNGYTFNVPSWTGILESFDVNDGGGVNDGYINNTGGATVATFSGTFGAGTANSMILSGSFFCAGSGVNCPLDFQTGASATIDNSFFTAGGLTFSNNSTGQISNTRITSGAVAAVTMSSSAVWTLQKCVVSSSNNPALAGAGAGTLTLNDITFTSNTVTAGTLTIATTGGTYPSGSLGSSGDVWTSNGAGAVPTFQAAGGALLQQVRTNTSSVFSIVTVIPYDDTIPQKTEGDEILTLAITPISATSVLMIESTFFVLGSEISNASSAFFVDAVSDALYTSTLTYGGAGYTQVMKMEYYESSASTSARTYKLRVGPSAGTLRINADNVGVRKFGGTAIATLTVTEYSS